MRALLDTDVVLDLLLSRVPFARAAGELFDLHEQGVFEAYVSAVTPVNIFYVGRKATNSADVRQAIGRLLGKVRVCPLDHSILTTALSSPIADYEDAVQHDGAVAAGLDAVVTRNTGDYRSATLPVFTPEAFINHMKSQLP
jgi:predicted nucleic acid-binding protein